MFDNRSIVYDGDEPVALVGSLRDVTERSRPRRNCGGRAKDSSLCSTQSRMVSVSLIWKASL